MRESTSVHRNPFLGSWRILEMEVWDRDSIFCLVCRRFTRSLVKDILTFPALADATIALMDIDPNRLADIAKAVDRFVSEVGRRQLRSGFLQPRLEPMPHLPRRPLVGGRRCLRQQILLLTGIANKVIQLILVLSRDPRIAMNQLVIA